MIKIGDKIGNLTVLSKNKNTAFGQYWLCQCSCGKSTIVREDNLENGRMGFKGGTRSCGHLITIQNKNNGIKRVNRIGEIVNNYKYILRLLPDSNRSYNYLYYDLITNYWRTSDPRHIKDLKHNISYEYKTAEEALSAYYQKNKNKFSSRWTEENNIINLLCDNNIIWTKQFSFENCKNILPLPFDFAIYTNQLNLCYLIEYDGQQHFINSTKGYFDRSYDDIHKNDLKKNKFCFKNNIPLIRIPYDANYTIDDLKLKTTQFLLTPENEKQYYNRI